MPISSPPSSRRLQANGLHIPVTKQSQAMRSLARLVLEREYTFMVVHPDDAAEVRSFAASLTREGQLEPRSVYPENGTFCQSDLDLSDEERVRGIIARRIHQYPKTMQEELVRLHRRGQWYDILLGIIPSIEQFDRMANTASNEFLKLFTPKPLTWPSLKEREADLAGILHAFAGILTSRDGRVQAVLSASAVDAILSRTRRARRTMELYVRVRDAFDVMLLTPGATEITSEHVEIASNRDKRRQLFISSSASAD